ncbi:hypothetical protein ACTD5D_34420 [Nocardia takedensis]|uniref:hypothetical protein n=1 Tax=Nocardia takedensis TaxID=259390 RepID=UPI0002D96F51|nr:hypothetical protein [Nocardia takedensis]
MSSGEIADIDQYAAAIGSVLIRRGWRPCGPADETSRSPSTVGTSLSVSHCLSGWGVADVVPRVEFIASCDDDWSEDAYVGFQLRSVAVDSVLVEAPPEAMGESWQGTGVFLDRRLLESLVFTREQLRQGWTLESPEECVRGLEKAMDGPVPEWLEERQGVAKLLATARHATFDNVVQNFPDPHRLRAVMVLALSVGEVEGATDLMSWYSSLPAFSALESPSRVQAFDAFLCERFSAYRSSRGG